MVEFDGDTTPSIIITIESEDTMLSGMNSVSDRPYDWQTLQLSNMQSLAGSSLEYVSTLPRRPVGTCTFLVPFDNPLPNKDTFSQIPQKHE